MQPRHQISRRSSLSTAPVAGVGVAAVDPAAAAQNGTQPGGGNDFRVGCLNVSSYSHLEGGWAPLINAKPENDEISFTGMRLTHCWDIDSDRAKKFAETYGCKAVKNFDDMLGKVDGIISGGYYNHPWNHILHEPYLEAGLPNLINRPFSNSLAKAQKMVETACANDATIMVPSAYEHNDTISVAKTFARDRIVAFYHATNSIDDYPTHGIHGVYLVCRAIVEAGNPVITVSFRTNKWHSSPGVMTLEHRDKEGRQFFGTLHQFGGARPAIRIHAQQEMSGRNFEIPNGSEYPFNKTQMWAPTVWAYERMARIGKLPQSFEQILHKHNVFMAGWRSVLKNNGNPVRLDEVPDDWETPVELPNRPGDPTAAMFRKKFG